MKNILLFSFLLISFSCKKGDGQLTVSQVMSYLTNDANKTWKLKAISINGQSQTLTAAQNAFTKSYSKDGTWVNSDGEKGTFSILTITSLKETTTNLTSNYTIQYDMLTINGSSLIVEYTYNQSKYKFEFTS